jgi:cell wall-associated NlpC family hydrolase
VTGAGRVIAGVGSLVAAAGAAVLAMLVTVISVLPGAAAGPSPTPDAATPASQAVADIPAVYVDAFDRAGSRFGVPWSVLAGVYRVECDFGQSTLPGCPRGTANRAGAQGPGQFLPRTWRASLHANDIIPVGPPAAAGAGYATDGDGDGVADPWDPYDAVASTARLLVANGAATDVSGAVFAYNHDPQYVTEVMTLAAGYQRQRSVPSAGSGDTATEAPSSGRIAAVIAFASQQVGLPYLWGGSGPAAWDCSGLVQAAYRRAGVLLTHDAAAQYTATAATAVPLGALRPADLVFFGRSAGTIHHVGIAIDASHMLDAPYTGTVVRIDPVAAPDLLVATRPLG